MFFLSSCIQRCSGYLDDETYSEHSKSSLRLFFFHSVRHNSAAVSLASFFLVSLQTVDAKKLEKAEAKLKAKHERRNEKDSLKASSPLSVHTHVHTCTYTHTSPCLTHHHLLS